MPGFHRARFRARLFDVLQPFETVLILGQPHKFYCPDRKSVYWVQHGSSSEPSTNRWIETMTADCKLVDVGANVGFFSIYAAAHGVREIIAIEPNPISFNALCRNALSNGYGEIISPLNLAVFNRTGWVNFCMRDLAAGSINSSINTSKTPGLNQLKLPGFDLDSLMKFGFLNDATHLKIDIDGLEPEVIRGAMEFLATPSLKSVAMEHDGDHEKIAERDRIMNQLGFRATQDFGFQPNYSFFVK